MGFLYFLGAVIAIVVDYFIAKEFQNTAYEKGFDDAKYFWYSFLLQPVGMLMVIALPDLKARPKNMPDNGSRTDNRYEKSELPDL